jgi:hypothetical protein
MAAIQVIPDRVCPVCREERWTLGWVEAPLDGMRIGGYGEATRLELEICRCGVRENLRQAVSPR